MAYDAKAVEFVYSFYARGWSKAKALPEICKVYAGFSGSTWDSWEAKYEWKQRRALADAKVVQFEDECRDIGRTLLLELNEARSRLFKKIVDGDDDIQVYYAFVSLAKRTAEMSQQFFANRDPERVAAGLLNDAIEHLLLGLREIPGLTRALEENSAKVGAAVAATAERFAQ